MGRKSREKRERRQAEQWTQQHSKHDEQQEAHQGPRTNGALVEAVCPVCRRVERLTRNQLGGRWVVLDLDADSLVLCSQACLTELHRVFQAGRERGWAEDDAVNFCHSINASLYGDSNWRVPLTRWDIWQQLELWTGSSSEENLATHTQERCCIR